jgi:hypothetical protein
MVPRRDEESGRYGFWGRDGWAVAPQFGYAHNFLSGYAAVDGVDGRPGLIGMQGTFLPLEEICGGRTPVREESSSFTGFVDLDSQPSRHASVCTEDRGRRAWGLIDTSLTYTPLPDEVFSGATGVSPFGEYVVIRRATGPGAESSCGLFHLGDMRLELPAEYSCIDPSRESLWVVSRPVGERRETHRFAFYDVSRREFLPGWYWGALPFSCGLGAIREEDGRSYFVDEGLRPAFDAMFDDVGRFSHGLAAVYDGADAGYIDATGRMHLLLPYDELQPFNEFGLALANRDAGEWDIDVIDREGRPRLARLETAAFWEGDFPHFEVSKGGEHQLFDIELNRIF